MKNIVILVLGLQAHVVLSKGWINPRISDAIAVQAKAYEAIDSLKHLLKFSEPSVSCSGNTVTTTIEVVGPRHALEAFDAEKAAYEAFMNTYIISTLGDGFMCGIILGSLIRSCKLRLFTKDYWKWLVPTMCVVLGLAIKQSATVDTVKHFYLNYSTFTEQKRFIATANKHSVGRVVAHLLGLLCGTVAGTCATQYVIDRLHGTSQQYS